MYQRYEYIPLDYVNIQIVGKTQDHFFNVIDSEFWHNDLSKTGIPTKDFYIDNMRLRMFQNEFKRIKLTGSLHKFSNGGKHNYNQFTKEMFYSALEGIQNTFDINVYNMKILGLEYGLNLRTSFDPSLILNHMICNRRRFFESPIDRKKGRLIQIKGQKEIIKAYNKGLQYQLEEPLFRFELKVRNWSEFRINHGIDTVEDFLVMDKKVFVERLINVWNSTLMFNPFNPDKYHKYSNFNYWRDIQKNKTNQGYSYHVEELNKMNNSSGFNIQKNVSDLIIQNVNSLQT